MKVLTLLVPLFCKHYQGINRAVMENSSTPEIQKTKTSKQDQESSCLQNRRKPAQHNGG